MDNDNRTRGAEPEVTVEVAAGPSGEEGGAAGLGEEDSFNGAESDQLVNRELSWLSFNDRVLQEARDPANPLFERINFLAIFSSNLTEFFRVRVAYWRSLLRLKKKKVRLLSVNPYRLLSDIQREVLRQQDLFGETFRGQILPELARHGIYLVAEATDQPSQEFLSRFFREHVLPLLRPAMLEGQTSPFLKNQAIYLVVELWPRSSIALAAETPQYGLVEVPSPPLDRFITLPRENTRDRKVVMFLDDLVRHNLPMLFPGWDVGGAHAIKLSRDADLHLEDEFSGDIVAAIRKSLAKRDTGQPTRFLYDPQSSHALVSHLKELFGLEDEDMVIGGRYHNLHNLRTSPASGQRSCRSTSGHRSHIQSSREPARCWPRSVSVTNSSTSLITPTPTLCASLPRPRPIPKSKRSCLPSIESRVTRRY